MCIRDSRECALRLGGGRGIGRRAVADRQLGQAGAEGGADGCHPPAERRRVDPDGGGQPGRGGGEEGGGPGARRPAPWVALLTILHGRATDSWRSRGGAVREGGKAGLGKTVAGVSRGRRGEDQGGPAAAARQGEAGDSLAGMGSTGMHDSIAFKEAPREHV